MSRTVSAADSFMPGRQVVAISGPSAAKGVLQSGQGCLNTRAKHSPAEARDEPRGASPKGLKIGL
eukprot:scaffold4353_cov26-Phaeocystis_antarctica.AAC.1